MKDSVQSGYSAEFQDILPGSPSLGKVCVLPWDTETFGFTVGAYRTSAERLNTTELEMLKGQFFTWASENRVVLCSCVIPPAFLFWKQWLPTLDFSLVDLALSASMNGLQGMKPPKMRAQLRIAQPEDWEAIEHVAAQSFVHGRYHADPAFPRSLADRRYKDWIRRALTGQTRADQVFVLGPPGSVKGFYHFAVEDASADLRLVAVSKQFQGTGLGFILCLSTLHVLRDMGVNRVTTTISGANTSVLNTYSTLGFRFSNPKFVYHWHRGEPREIVHSATPSGSEQK